MAVTLVDTGENTMTAAASAVANYVRDDEAFCAYGDGVADVDLRLSPPSSAWSPSDGNCAAAVLRGLQMDISC